MENIKILQSIQAVESKQIELADSVIKLATENDQLKKQFEEANNRVNSLQEQLTSAEKTITAFKDLLLSAKPIKNVYNPVGIGRWVRVYHTDSNWLDNHNKNHQSKYTDEIIGFALTKNPADMLK
jgi:hypothetical protein